LLLMVLGFAAVPVAAAGLQVRYRSRLSMAAAADWAALGATVLLLLIYIGAFVAGRTYGTATDVPWGVDVAGAVRHPVQLYNAAATGVMLLVLWRLRPHLLPGEIFWRFILFYSLSHLIFADFCADAVTWGPGIRMEQTLALATLLGSMYVLSCYAQRRAQRRTQSAHGAGRGENESRSYTHSFVDQ
jgi:phosphatidylglycerol:prolipoprotein diacylglycerol transferase